MDVPGTVEAVGQNVTQFQTGDEVFGTCDGSFAEYAFTPQDRVARKPADLTSSPSSARAGIVQERLTSLSGKGQCCRCWCRRSGEVGAGGRSGMSR